MRIGSYSRAHCLASAPFGRWRQVFDGLHTRLPVIASTATAATSTTAGGGGGTSPHPVEPALLFRTSSRITGIQRFYTNAVPKIPVPSVLFLSFSHMFGIPWGPNFSPQHQPAPFLVQWWAVADRLPTSWHLDPPEITDGSGWLITTCPNKFAFWIMLNHVGSFWDI